MARGRRAAVRAQSVRTFLEARARPERACRSSGGSRSRRGSKSSTARLRMYFSTVPRSFSSAGIRTAASTTAWSNNGELGRTSVRTAEVVDLREDVVRALECHVQHHQTIDERGPAQVDEVRAQRPSAVKHLRCATRYASTCSEGAGSSSANRRCTWRPDSERRASSHRTRTRSKDDRSRCAPLRDHRRPLGTGRAVAVVTTRSSAASPRASAG
jgi:hypothetical protein